MYNIKFLQEPGFLYDLISLFIIHFNKNRLTNYMPQKSTAENIKFFEQLEYEFTPIPDELVPFFYLNENQKCFLTRYCYYDNIETYQINFKFEHMQDDLLDAEKLVFELIRFYFPKLNDDQIEDYRNNLDNLMQLVDESNYSDYIKEKLCIFFVSYKRIIKKLNFELISKETQLRQYYERNYKKIAYFENEIDFNEFCFDVFKDFDKQYKYNQNSNIYISPCIIAISIICSYFLDNSAIVLLGINGGKVLEFLRNREKLVNLDVFGTAVSEPNRVGIINALLERNEMSIRDIEKMFDISNTNAYYHLSLMLKANIINVRNQGRTMLYSLNRSYFDGLIEALKKYSSKSQEEAG